MDPAGGVVVIPEGHQCPLCALSFEGLECHSRCPVGRHCNLVRCPRCGYEFADRSAIVDWFRRLFRSRARIVPDILPLSDLPVGNTATVVSIESSSPSRLQRLSVYGIVPGTDLRMLQRLPAHVIACGHTTIALDEEVTRAITVRLSRT